MGKGAETPTQVQYSSQVQGYSLDFSFPNSPKAKDVPWIFLFTFWIEHSQFCLICALQWNPNSQLMGSTIARQCRSRLRPSRARTVLNKPRGDQLLLTQARGEQLEHREELAHLRNKSSRDFIQVLIQVDKDIKNTNRARQICISLFISLKVPWLRTLGECGEQDTAGR